MSRGALLASARVHLGHLATDRRIEHAHVTLGIAGDVGRHMADRPVGETRWLRHLVIGQMLQRGDHGPCALSLRRGRGRRSSSSFSPYPARERGNLAGMQIAMVGLGRMGANMVRRLQRAGHDCVAYDLNPAAVQAIEAEGARGAGTPQQVVDALTAPRHIWLMVPAAYVSNTIEAFAPLLSPGDTLIDGGNSWYRDDIERAGPLREKGINYIDVGTSGGVFGLDRGYSLMVGGPIDAVAEMAPIFTDLAPGPGEIVRTPVLQR